MQLSDIQKKWIIVHFKNTKKDEIVGKFNITHSSLHRFARKNGLKKTKKFMVQCQTNATMKATLANKQNNWPPKGYKIPKSEENRFKKGITPLKRLGKKKNGLRIKKSAESRKKTFALEKAKAIWGIEQRTKLKVIKQPKSKISFRYNLKKRGYIVGHNAKSIFYNQNTKRSLSIEKKGFEKFRFNFLEE